MTSKVLAGLRVIELSEVWAGPTAGSLLGDLGADVIKVESYPRNSQTRTLVDGGPGTAPGDGPPYERSGIHHLANRNKRHITLNLRHQDGAEPFRRLVRGADLLYEGYSAGTLERMGWGWDVLREINPRLVMVSMPGWGKAGPYQGYVTLGSGLDASAGHTAVRGYPGDSPEETRSIYHSDATGALTLIFAALTGLRQREHTSEGCFIDMSQIEVLVAHMPGLFAEWTLLGRKPAPLGNVDPHIVPHDAYPATGDDQWVFVAAETDAQWAGLARALGHDDWAADGHPWATVTGRLAARAEIDVAIAEYTRARSAEDAAASIQEAGAIAAPIVNPPELLASPHIQARNWIQWVTHRYAGTNAMPGFLWSIAQDPPTWDRPSGLVGEHIDEVFAELGYTQAEIDAFERDGVIGRSYALPS
jgi:crotonobetainyl-CoA:carnitine CoA-transferase CaiB-like acyl-CoA transferase